MRLPSLCLISDADRIGSESFLRALEAAWGAGLRWVLVREPSWNDSLLQDLLAGILAITGPGQHVFLSWRPNLACEREALVERFGLRGIHVGGCGPAVVSDLRRRWPTAAIGYSAHSVADVQTASSGGADYVSLAPVFSPTSKGFEGPALGLSALRRACRNSLPVYALGGIDPERARLAVRAGAKGAAVIGAILDAQDAAGATRDLLSALEITPAHKAPPARPPR